MYLIYHLRPILYVIISIVLNLLLIKHVKPFKQIKLKQPIIHILFGLHTTLVGILIYYIVHNKIYFSPYAHNISFFIAYYIITTGFIISLMGYIKK